ncbi:OmpA family protein [uncultured Jannaschia sp.]|uniref:OmpA family protein n=1 Tax=uncultured Jannaschia sp. TaxID=293347 RepID=UPI0026366364|nr:OmpA family protein [uncultured Jannaschia sp.]
MRALAVLAITMGAAQADVPDLPLPAAPTFAETVPLTSYRFATGPFANGVLPAVVAEGALTRRIWQVAAPGASALQIIAPLRDALLAEGWTVTFECRTRACGGFDFRFEIDVIPAPEMFVDLADFRYLAAQKGDARIALLASPSGDLAYVQAAYLDPDGTVEAVTKSASNPPPAPSLSASSDVTRTLTETGHAVLDDLDFPTGSTQLPGTDYASLATLATFLRDNATATIALVGHTDAEGTAESNMAISRRRADAAKAILTGTHGIAPGRIETHGVGFFAPIARNDTPEGRTANRRVEVVLTSTE